jgi:hypothetical protein
MATTAKKGDRDEQQQPSDPVVNFRSTYRKYAFPWTLQLTLLASFLLLTSAVLLSNRIFMFHSRIHIALLVIAFTCLAPLFYLFTVISQGTFLTLCTVILTFILIPPFLVEENDSQQDRRVSMIGYEYAFALMTFLLSLFIVAYV